MALQLTPQRIVATGVGPPIKLLGNSSRRVFVTFVQSAGAAACIISPFPDASFNNAIDDLNQSISNQWLRHDWGDLVTGEWYAGDGAGNAPNATFTLVEATLISE